MKLFGNYTALITPFKNQRQVDFETFEILLKRQVSQGSSGVVLFGSTGEGHLLSKQEKTKLFKIAKQNAPENFAVIVAILQYSTADCKKEIRYFSRLGADAFLISVPPYIKPTQTGIYKHFTELANHSEKPIILYNIPSRTGVNIEFETIKKLSQNQNIIGIKEASSCFSDIVKESALISNNFQMLAGNDNFILPMLAVGASGVVSVAGNIIPRTMQTIFEMFKFDPDFCKNLYEKFKPLIDVLSVQTNPIPIKYAMSLLLSKQMPCRKPLCEPDKQQKDLIKDIFNKLIKK